MTDEFSTPDLPITVHLKRTRASSVSIFFVDGEIALPEDEEVIVLTTAIKGGATGPKHAINEAFRLVRVAMRRSTQESESDEPGTYNVAVFIQIAGLGEILESLELSEERPYDFLLDCDFGFKWRSVSDEDVAKLKAEWGEK